MSTTYLPAKNYVAAFYLTSAYATNRNQAARRQAPATSSTRGIDEGLLMVGVFCFLIPTMFAAASLGLKYLEMSDLVANGLYIAGAALIARIGTAFIMKNMAAEKNRSQAVWMTIAMIAPSVSLILMSFFGTIAKMEKTATPSTQKTQTATIKKYNRAREIQMHRTSQAI